MSVDVLAVASLCTNLSESCHDITVLNSNNKRPCCPHTHNKHQNQFILCSLKAYLGISKKSAQLPFLFCFESKLYFHLRASCDQGLD